MFNTVYSMTSLDDGEDEAGLLQSTQAIRALVNAEADGSAPGLNGHRVPLNRIVVAGFSQGGAISLLTGLTSPVPLAGVGALSTWLPLHRKIASMRPTQATFPLFQAHGTADTLVNFEFGQQTHTYLKQLGFTQAEWHQYDGMAHGACPAEITDLGAWLAKVVPNKS